MERKQILINNILSIIPEKRLDYCCLLNLRRDIKTHTQLYSRQNFIHVQK